ncbi:MAG: glycosyltransferase, partial [Burkholderia sp.]|nr:glycosyltransferase [Burkholderia sp.]
RARRDTDTWFKRTTARGYYALLRMFGVDIVVDHADFRLMSRRALDALHGFHEVNLFLRGIVPLLGFPTAIVTYDRAARQAGESKYPLRRMIALALEGIFSFSTVPLRWITWLGLTVSAAALAFAAWAIIIRLFTERAVPGWASTVVPMFFLGGVQLLALGVIGGYLSRVYAEAKQRPRFIVEKAL